MDYRMRGKTKTRRFLFGFCGLDETHLPETKYLNHSYLKAFGFLVHLKVHLTIQYSVAFVC